MEKYVYIRSYAHAEHLGITPFDSLISTVIDLPRTIKDGKPRIAAFSITHGFMSQDNEKYTVEPTKDYICEPRAQYRMRAANILALKALLAAEFAKGVTIRVYQN